ncbi:MAG: PAS domain S-box protein [Candidatus Neomarinimicrobiota bacterium]
MANHRILIVDDDPRIRKTLADILTIKGYDCETVSGSREALDYLTREIPDLALIDLKLEDGSGIDLLTEIKAFAPGVECILLTGFASQETAIQALNHGAFSYLQKPYDIEQLLLAIRRALEKAFAEKAVLQSENDYRQLFEAAHDAIIIFRPDNEIVLNVNSAACELYGYTRDEFIGMSLRQVSTNVATGERRVAEIVGEKMPLSFETNHVRRNGDEIAVEITAVMIEFGGDPAILSVTRDITERKIALATLQESEERWRSLAESSPDHILTLNRDLEIVFANYAAPGLTVADLIGKKLYQFVDKSHQAKIKALLKSVIEKRKDVRYETEYIAPDGGKIYYETHALPQILGDDVVGLTMSARDISERKLVEQTIAERSRELALINELNEAANGGATISELIDLFSSGSNRLFPNYGAVVYLVNAGGDSLELYNSGLTGTLLEKIAGLLGTTIPKVRIPLSADSIFTRILAGEKLAVFEDPADIRQMITEHARTAGLSRLVGSVYKLLGIKLVVTILLRSGQKTIGLLMVSEGLADESDRVRLERIANQLTGLIRRKQAEEGVIQSAQEWQATFNAMSDAIWLVDMDGKIVRHNQTTADWLQTGTAAIDGRYCWELVHGTSAPIPECPILKMKKSLRRESRELPLGERWIDITVDPILDSDHKLSGAVHIIKDITERKTTEILIRQERDRAQMYLDVAGALFIGLDQRGRITLANRVAREVLEIGEANIIGRDWFANFLPQRLRRMVKAVFKQIITGEVKAVEFFENEVLTATGKEKIIYWHNSELRDADGAIVGLLSSGIDVTERKRAELEVLEYSQRLKRLTHYLRDSIEQERMRISREIHDELGQALTAMKIDLDLMREDIQDTDKVLRKIDGVSDLINHTLTQTRRISADLRPSILDDLGLVPALEWYIDDFAERTGIRCRFTNLFKVSEVPATTGTVIFRVLVEAMTNAVRHSRADTITIRLWNTRNEIKLKVHDNGIGISATAMANKKSLGLIGMQERVQFYGGRIAISGRPDKGTEILMQLPLESTTDPERIPGGKS